MKLLRILFGCHHRQQSGVFHGHSEPAYRRCLECGARRLWDLATNRWAKGSRWQYETPVWAKKKASRSLGTPEKVSA